jgi:hypothetical protein
MGQVFIFPHPVPCMLEHTRGRSKPHLTEMSLPRRRESI